MLDRSTITVEKNLILPPQFQFTIATSSALAFDDYAAALSKSGIILLHLGFDDPEACIMKTIVENIGRIDIHDRQGTTIWDVKFDRQAKKAKGTRSLTTKEFPLHTDASFEEPTPKYVALYVVVEDNLGGGISQFVDSKAILAHLDIKTISILRTSKFKFKVPLEFMKGEDFIAAPIIYGDENFRYRREIILLDDCCAEQLQALDRLDLVLRDKGLIESIFLKTGTMIIFDNGRFLHGRTKINDQNRHLKRMRFHAKE